MNVTINRVRLKEIMDKNQIPTQTELAKRLGITKNQLSVMLSDKYVPYKSTFLDMCELLNINPEMIVDFDNSKKKSITIPKLIGSNHRITAIELFAGGGGLALGLEQAGIDTLMHVEIDKFCCETLKFNRPRWNVICEDISNIDFLPYRDKVDIVTGGFPCQAFSYAGKKLGFEDTRGTLFYEFARCIRETNPNIFMAENVRGLISHDQGRTLDTIIRVLEGLGYYVQKKLLNAVDYGVPQKRERIVIIGTKCKDVFTYPKKNLKWLTIKDALKNVPISEGQNYSETKRKVLELVPPGGCWRHLPIDVQKSYMGKSFFSTGGRTGMARRISWDEPCLTLTCSPSQKQTERCHPEETRPFTVREYARIQTFPDQWNFCGGIGAKYKQIGNAVPVKLAKKIGVQLVKALQKQQRILNTHTSLDSELKI